MRINIMSKYQVKYKNKYSQRVEDDMFEHDTFKWNRKMPGHKLIEIIAHLMQDTNFFTITSNESEIHIMLFNINTGEDEDITIQYTRLEK